MDLDYMLSNFKNYWANKGGKFGRCHSHPDSDLCWINIPKNASSWTQTLLAHEFLWYEHDYHEQPELQYKKKLICLRDPVERWVSGITEFFFQYYPKVELDQINDLTLWLIYDRIAFDDHTEKQSLFLEGLDPENCVFFRCDHSYSKNFLDYFVSIGYLDKTYIVPECVNAHRYDHSLIEIKKPIYNFFQSRVENDHKLRQSIAQYCQADYNLLKNADFYHAEVL